MDLQINITVLYNTCIKEFGKNDICAIYFYKMLIVLL